MNHTPLQFKNKKGFTLVEILIVTVIFTLVVFSLTLFERDIFYLNSVQTGSLLSAEDSQSILRTITKELGSVSPGSDGSYPIVTAGTSTLTFFCDIYGNGIKEKITYTLSSTTLQKTVVIPTGVPLSYSSATGTVYTLASGVRNTATSSIFDYFDSNYTGTSSPLTQPVSVAAVHLVRITLVLDSNKNQAPGAVSYVSDVSLRNLKNNL